MTEEFFIDRGAATLNTRGLPVNDRRASKRKLSQLSEDPDDNDNTTAIEESEAVLTENPVNYRPEPQVKSVWVDEDDTQQEVNLLQVPRRKKLRKSLAEKRISAVEYAERVRELHETRQKARSVGVGTWAELPSERRRRKRRRARKQREGPSAESEDDDDSVSEESSDEEQDDDRLTKEVKTLLRRTRSAKIDSDEAMVADGGRVKLKPGVLAIRPVLNANAEESSLCEARCVEFHPSGKLLLTAGLDKTLRIFQVDGEQNAKVQSMHMEKFPIHTAKFTGGGEQVVMAGRRRFFKVFDMQKEAVSNVHMLSTHEERSWERFVSSADGERLAFFGQHGKMVIVNNKNKREIGQVRLNGRIASAAFSPCAGREHELYTTSVEGTVYLWDIRKMAVVDQHMDEGVVHSTCMAASAAHYATGNDSGVVNVYKSSQMRGAEEAEAIQKVRTEVPVKSVLNLRTRIDDVVFNPDGQLMALSSHEMRNAVRILHTGRMSVYANWPSSRTNIRRACRLAFSPGGGFLAVGNDKGDVQLLRVMAYPAW